MISDLSSKINTGFNIDNIIKILESILPNAGFSNFYLAVFDGNGGFLTTMALMCAGWEGNKANNPGFPKSGDWNVKWA